MEINVITALCILESSDIVFASRKKLLLMREFHCDIIQDFAYRD